MKIAFCDTLKNGQFQYKSMPQKSLDLIEYTHLVCRAHENPFIYKYVLNVSVRMKPLSALEFW